MIEVIDIIHVIRPLLLATPLVGVARIYDVYTTSIHVDIFAF
nr:MAG TPA: hypothetical protein [Caudoviricetes sp.]